MPQPFDSVIAANRFGLGARPGELALGGGARDWLAGQLGGGPPALVDGELRTTADILSQALELRRERRAARAAATDSQAPQAGAALKLGQLFRPAYVAEVDARFRRAVATSRPFMERLVYFWSNHFAVSVDKVAVLGVAGSFEREAIRPNVLGSFAGLLLAAERHPAMLLYLDNHVSVGPDSELAQRAARRDSERRPGINENLAREILELHTLGVGGGYSQTDVTSFAQVITGWSIGGEPGGVNHGVPGEFVFRPELHEPGAKVVLGKRYAEAGVDEGVAVLRDVAMKPATAHFIATKLARHFIADDPPATAVDRIARAFLHGGGDLPTVYRAVIESPEAWAQPFAKYKTPFDYIVSTFRALDLPVDAGRAGLAAFDLLGQRTYAPGSPAGWPDRSADWDGASALLKRIEWADAVGQRLGDHRDAAQLAGQLVGAALGAATRTAVARAASGAQALTLLLTAPEFLRR